MWRDQSRQGLAPLALAECAECCSCLLNRRPPINLGQTIRLRRQRRTEPRRIGHKTIIQPTCIAHPGLVDRIIATRYEAPDAIVMCAQHNVAAVGTTRAYAGGLLQKPHPDLMMEILG